MEHAGEEESLILEGDIGGGLILRRKISIPKDNPRVFRIASSIEARSVGAGSGGFSRFVYLLHTCLFSTMPLLLQEFIHIVLVRMKKRTYVISTLKYI